MTSLNPRGENAAHNSWLIVGAGIVALAVAMGVGRFAFTPMLPLMLRDGTITAATGAEWAAANYAGYLVGALTAARFSHNPRLGLLVALFGVAAATPAVALLDPGTSAIPGMALRAFAGVFSAWVLVCASSLCLAELARRHAAKAGGWIYTGVGAGIALTGTLTWLGGRQPAAFLWVELGLLAAAGACAVLFWLKPLSGNVPTAPIRRVGQSRESPVARNRTRAFVLCYGTFGFGYIVLATFLPAMAREQVADPLVFGLTWPLFGLAAALSVGAASRWLSDSPRRKVWALAQGAMALGTALTLLTHALWALALSAVLVGGTFMVCTMAGLQLARELTPDNPTPLLARMTVAFAAGQIGGPLIVRFIGTGIHWGWDALAWTNALATVLLGASAFWLWPGDPGK